MTDTFLAFSNRLKLGLPIKTVSVEHCRVEYGISGIIRRPTWCSSRIRVLYHHSVKIAHSS
ncbi:hypothetical protein CH063_09079, partial [Colletotrichum higginsianum]